MKATMKASDAIPGPMIHAISTSRAKPVMRDKSVNPPTERSRLNIRLFLPRCYGGGGPRSGGGGSNRRRTLALGPLRLALLGTSPVTTGEKSMQCSLALSLLRRDGRDQLPDQRQDASHDDLHACRIGMDAVGLVQFRVHRHAVEDEGIEQHAEPFRQPGIDRIELRS